MSRTFGDKYERNLQGTGWFRDKMACNEMPRSTPLFRKRLGHKREGYTDSSDVQLCGKTSKDLVIRASIPIEIDRR